MITDIDCLEKRLKDFIEDPETNGILDIEPDIISSALEGIYAAKDALKRVYAEES